MENEKGKKSFEPRRPMSDLALASRRANMAKAIAARKSPRGNASARLNALSHRLFVRDVAASVGRMGEDSREFRERHALILIGGRFGGSASVSEAGRASLRDLPITCLCSQVRDSNFDFRAFRRTFEF